MSKRFAPSVWDRLMNDPVDHSPDGADFHLTLEQLKDTVARDLGDMFNTRAAISQDVLVLYPECRKSLLNYGLRDFGGLCLTSSVDRKLMCDSVKAAIERHEPRLFHVTATLAVQSGQVNRLNFGISATLVAHGAATVQFDAVLQPSSLSYSVHRPGRRPQRDQDGNDENLTSVR
ncbi:MAG: type VI secretion system baseplate subunit TssE [Telluria sp.]|nr:type VI secretion system baseplate subunit TssE [Telluria sp.]